MKNLTNKQQDIVNQLISEFENINKLPEQTDDIFAYIDGKVDDKRKLRAELELFDKSIELGYIAYADEVTSIIKPMMEKYGYSLKNECFQNSKASHIRYFKFTLQWDFDKNYLNGRRHETELYIIPPTTHYDGIESYRKSYKICVENQFHYATEKWSDLNDLKLAVANMIVERLKLKV